MFINIFSTRWQTRQQLEQHGRRQQQRGWNYHNFETTKSNTCVQGNFELFVDRQRQAAVVLGERDIAGDNKAKRRRER